MTRTKTARAAFLLTTVFVVLANFGLSGHVSRPTLGSAHRS